MTTALESFKKRGLIGKIEVTEGTDPTPTALANGILLYDGTSRVTGDKQELEEDRPHFSNNEFSWGNERAEVEGSFMLYPPAVPGHASSTGDADCSIILLPAGMTQVKDAVAETTRFNPISTAISSATYYWWHVDAKKKLLGSRVAVSGLRMAIGSRFMGKARIQGSIPAGVTKESVPAITKPSTRAVVSSHLNSRAYVNVASAGEMLIWCKELSVDFGSDLKSEEFTSVQFQSIGDRKGTWMMRMARDDLATFNPWAVRSACSVFETRYRTYVSAAVGRYSELGIRGQIEDVQIVDIDGKAGWQLSGPCIASSAGGDEFYAQFGDDTP